MTVNASPSAIYRSIGLSPGDPPTILLDEADTLFGHAAGDHEDLRGILNAGHQRNRPALRYDAAARSVEEIETYAMAALAGIGRMPDTIEDRAVIIKMRRRAPDEHVAPYRVRRDGPPLGQLKRQLHVWARHHVDELSRAEPEMPLEDRAADTWEALVAVADLAGDHWPTAARYAATALTTEAIEDDEDTIPVQLLADCRRAFADRDMLRTAELLSELKADSEAPWSTHGPAGLTPRTLAGILREFGIRSGTHRFPSGKAKGYAANDFLDAWNRYLPTLEVTDRDPPGVPQEKRGIRGKRGAPGHSLGSATDGRPCHPNQPWQLPSTTHRDHRPNRPIDQPGGHHE